MKIKDYWKRILAVTILCFFIMPTISSVGVGHYAPNLDTDLDTNSVIRTTDVKPDFKIVDVRIEYDRNHYPRFILSVLNSGGMTTWNGEGRLTIKKLFQPVVVDSMTSGWGTNYHHNSGEIKEILIGSIDVRYSDDPFLYRILFDVDPYNRVNESNENNNGLWTYFFGIYLPIGNLIKGFFKMGKLKPWTTGNEGIINNNEYSEQQSQQSCQNSPSNQQSNRLLQNLILRHQTTK